MHAYTRHIYTAHPLAYIHAHILHSICIHACTHTYIQILGTYTTHIHTCPCTYSTDCIHTIYMYTYRCICTYYIHTAQIHRTHSAHTCTTCTNYMHTHVHIHVCTHIHMRTHVLSVPALLSYKPVLSCRPSCCWISHHHLLRGTDPQESGKHLVSGELRAHGTAAHQHCQRAPGLLLGLQ